MAPRAFVYCRISNDKEGAGLGVQRQEEDCRKLAAQQGYEVAAVFTDNDISAYSGKRRPGYRAMLAKLGEVEAVVAWHTDRLHRQPSELEEYIDICRERGVITHTVQSGKLDLVTPTGIFVASMFGNLARYESAHKAERVKRAMEQKIRAGKWAGGARPFGWVFDDGKPVICEEEAAIVRHTFDHVVSGGSLGSWVDKLNDLGVTTSVGKPWGYSQLRQMMLRPRNAGLASLHGEIVGTSEFPPIVTENVWRAGCSILQDPTRRRSQSNKAVHLLAGIAQCHCGALVRSATVTARNGEKHKVYRCPVKGKGHVGKRVEYVDAVVNPMMVALRSIAARHHSAEDDTTTEEMASLETELKALRQRHYDMAIQAAEGMITASQLSIITNRINQNIEKVERRLADLQMQAARPVVPEGITPISMDRPEAEEWLATDIDSRRDFVRSVCNIVLLPHGNGSTKVFNPDTVRIVLKRQDDAPGPLTIEEIAKTINAIELSNVEEVLSYWPQLQGKL